MWLNFCPNLITLFQVNKLVLAHLSADRVPIASSGVRYFEKCLSSINIFYLKSYSPGLPDSFLPTVSPLPFHSHRFFERLSQPELIILRSIIATILCRILLGRLPRPWITAATMWRWLHLISFSLNIMWPGACGYDDLALGQVLRLDVAQRASEASAHLPGQRNHGEKLYGEELQVCIFIP